MASNKRINKAYVRYDGNGRVIAGSLILNRFKPQVGNWQEIPAYECCNPSPVLYSFDVTADWSSFSVTDAASFQTFLESGSDGNANTNSLTGVVITDFSLVGNRLTCNLVASGTALNLANMGVTEVNGIGETVVIQELYLSNNNIVNFNPLVALPSTLTYLELEFNQIVTFDPQIALPSGLLSLYLGSNLIVTFNPSLPLPASLDTLGFYGNQIVSFNPSIPLPNPVSGFYLYLDNNAMTTAGYTASEPWANAMTVIPARGTVAFTGNVDSVSGTNLETILIAKGWTVAV